LGFFKFKIASGNSNYYFFFKTRRQFQEDNPQNILKTKRKNPICKKHFKTDLEKKKKKKHQNSNKSVSAVFRFFMKDTHTVRVSFERA
jgi:hypothetical protein